jgi:hypothetical protein
MIIVKKLTYEERATWGVCPVCNASAGDQCKGGGPHIARLINAPQQIVRENDKAVTASS